MKRYLFTLKHDSGTATIGIVDQNLESAKRRLLDQEKAPESAILYWSVVPTAKQLKNTKSLMRGL